MSAVVHIFRFSWISFPRNSLDFTTVPSAVCLLVEGPSEALATLRLSFSCFFPSSVPFAFKMVLHRVKTHEVDTVIAKEAEQHSSISIEIAVELLSLLLGCEAGYWSTYFSFLCQCCDRFGLCTCCTVRRPSRTCLHARSYVRMPEMLYGPHGVEHESTCMH